MSVRSFAPNPVFEVIPAIDLRGGAVVRACKGLRHLYLPIETPLAGTSAPPDVVAGLLTIYPFKTIYIADLDRIELRGNHELLLDQLGMAFPGVAFWVDAGVRNSAEAYSWLARHEQSHLVFGSESLENGSVLKDIAFAGRTVLSLDYRGDVFLGPSEIWDVPDLWPERVIVMTLARVGANSGPDMYRLEEVKRRAPDSKIYAAGGLRDSIDLLRLKQSGISGVLVASALHDGRLSGADIAAAMPQGAHGAK